MTLMTVTNDIAYVLNFPFYFTTYMHTCPAEFSIPTALRWPIHVHYSFSLSSMDHDFFYPHHPRRTPLQLDTYAYMPM